MVEEISQSKLNDQPRWILEDISQITSVRYHDVVFDRKGVSGNGMAQYAE
jgi:hypothetical protein